MNISKDLFLAILSLDSYNRGYGAGISGLSENKDTQIGVATVSTQIADVSKTFAAQAQAAGFYATAYEVGEGVEGIAAGTTVISYRGTDFADDEDFGDDVSMGWPMGGGDIGEGGQAGNAL